MIAAGSNHLQRDFQAHGPNQKRMADFAYIRTAEGYLSGSSFQSARHELADG